MPETRPAPEDPPVDVLIPVYNGARWLRASIESIQAQTHRDWRMQIVDDGSTDTTPDILAQMAAGDARIRLHRKPNGGIVDALNFGLRACTAPLIARHDADDIAHPHRLQAQLAYLARHPDCVAVGGTARHIDDEGRALGTTTQLRSPDDADASWFPAREPYLMHPLATMRRDAVQRAGGYRQVVYSEDSDLYWRLSSQGRLHNLPDVLADYRLHASSISSGSIHNGRLMAVSSQLAAASARRRALGATGRPDIPFDEERAARLRRSDTLRGMVDDAAADLDPMERAGFELAVAAKLLELASYLPYEPDMQDCRYIGGAVRRSGRSLPSAANRRALAGQSTRTAVRLCAQRRFGDALQLLPAPWLPEFALRCVIRGALPSGTRQRLHALRNSRSRVAP